MVNLVFLEFWININKNTYFFFIFALKLYTKRKFTYFIRLLCFLILPWSVSNSFCAIISEHPYPRHFRLILIRVSSSGKQSESDCFDRKFLMIWCYFQSKFLSWAAGNPLLVNPHDSIKFPFATSGISILLKVTLRKRRYWIKISLKKFTTNFSFKLYFFSSIIIDKKNKISSVFIKYEYEHVRVISHII